MSTVHQAIVVAGPIGSGAATLAREVADRIGGLRRKCSWSEFITPPGPRVLRQHPAVLIVEGLPDSYAARDIAVGRTEHFEPQLIFVARSATAFTGHPHIAVLEVERKAPTERKPQARHCPQLQLRDRVGLANAFELTLRFIAWAKTLHGDPTWQQIMARWDVSRATAYRWLRAWQDAKGVLSA